MEAKIETKDQVEEAEESTDDEEEPFQGTELTELTGKIPTTELKQEDETVETQLETELFRDTELAGGEPTVVTQKEQTEEGTQLIQVKLPETSEAELLTEQILLVRQQTPQRLQKTRHWRSVALASVFWHSSDSYGITHSNNNNNNNLTKVDKPEKLQLVKRQSWKWQDADEWGHQMQSSLAGQQSENVEVFVDMKLPLNGETEEEFALRLAELEQQAETQIDMVERMIMDDDVNDTVTTTTKKTQT